MRLHNSLVDYREKIMSSHHTIQDKATFESECTDNGINYVVVGNDSARPAGRTSNEDNINKQKGLYLRDNIKLAFAVHDMHLPRNNKR